MNYIIYTYVSKNKVAQKINLEMQEKFTKTVRKITLLIVLSIQMLIGYDHYFNDRKYLDYLKLIYN